MVTINDKLKNFTMAMFDAALIIFSLFLSVYLRFSGNIPEIWLNKLERLLLPAVLINLAVFYLFGFYRRVWRNTLVTDLLLIVVVVTVGIGCFYLYSLYNIMLPRSSYVIALGLMIIYVVASRLAVPMVLKELNTNDEEKLKTDILNFTLKGKNILLVFIFIAVTINILQFKAIDDRAIDRYKALNRYETADIMQIGQISPRHRQLYSHPIALGEHAPGSTVIIPTAEAYMGIISKGNADYEHLLRECVISAEQFRFDLLTIGRASLVLQKLYSAEKLMAGYDLTVYFVDSGSESYWYLPWAIAMGSSSANEFVYIRWESPTEGPYDILLDTSLLPEQIRKELNL